MIVPVRVDGAANEWCIVELQGELIPTDGTDMKNVSIGSLWYENGVPTMRIGNHIVAGKVAKLPKPFAILERHTPSASASTDTTDVDMEDPSDTQSSVPTSGSDSHFDVVGIARTRLIFSTRPKPVLT